MSSKVESPVDFKLPILTIASHVLILAIVISVIVGDLFIDSNRFLNTIPFSILSGILLSLGCWIDPIFNFQFKFIAKLAVGVKFKQILANVFYLFSLVLFWWK